MKGKNTPVLDEILTQCSHNSENCLSCHWVVRVGLAYGCAAHDRLLMPKCLPYSYGKCADFEVATLADIDVIRELREESYDQR